MPFRVLLSSCRQRWNRLPQLRCLKVQTIFIQKCTGFTVPILLIGCLKCFHFTFRFASHLKFGWLQASRFPTVGRELQCRTWWFSPYIFGLPPHSLPEFSCISKDQPFRNAWTFFEALWIDGWFACIMQWGFYSAP